MYKVLDIAQYYRVTNIREEKDTKGTFKFISQKSVDNAMSSNDKKQKTNQYTQHNV